MKVREYRLADCVRLRAMHAQQGLDYELPELDSPLMVVKTVVEDDDGRVVMAALARLTCEVYLLMEPPGHRQDACATKERWNALVALHQAAAAEAWRQGLDDAHCWVPPELARSFGRRLMKLGWTKPLWPSFTLRLPR